MYYFLEFQTHPQESINRVLDLTFLCVHVKITKAGKGSDFWLPFCLCELMDAARPNYSSFYSCLETEHEGCAPVTHLSTQVQQVVL